MIGKLEIDADLTCLLDDRIPVKISGADDVLQIHFSSFRDLFELSKRHTPSHQTRVALVRRAHHALKQGDLSASMMVAGKEIASLTPHYEGGLFGRLLGLGPLRLRPLAILLIFMKINRTSQST